MPRPSSRSRSCSSSSARSRAPSASSTAGSPCGSMHGRRRSRRPTSTCARRPSPTTCSTVSSGRARWSTTRRGGSTPCAPRSRSPARRVAAWSDVERVDEAVGSLTAAVVSEGDKAHAADVARAHPQRQRHRREAVRAVGRRRLARRLAGRGRAPGRRRAARRGGQSGNEGTAMLEILHDIAPRAELGFATAFRSDASFADNIRGLRFPAGCDVIVDDVLYFNEHPFQDGPIARAVNDVIADGALFFSSAGNEGNTVDGTSGNYEADFVDSGRRPASSPARRTTSTRARACRSSSRSRRTRARTCRSRCSGPTRWAARRATTTSTCSTRNSNVVAFSQDVQDGDDDPYERLCTPSAGGSTLRLAVVRYSRRGPLLPALRAARPVRELRRRARRAGDAGRDARPLGGGGRVQHGGRARRSGAAVRPRAGRPAEPDRPVPGGVHAPAAAGAVHVRRSAARVLPRRRHADHARATSARPAASCGRSPTSRRPTA